MEKRKTIKLIEKKIREVENLRTKPKWGNEYKHWKYEIEMLIRNIFGENSIQLEKFNHIWLFKSVATEDTDFQKIYIESLDEAKSYLKSLIQEMKIFSKKDDDFKNLLDTERPSGGQIAVTGILITAYLSILLLLPLQFGEFRLDIIRLGLVLLVFLWVLNLILTSLCFDKFFKSKKLAKYSSLSFTMINIVTVAIFSFWVAAYGSYFLGVFVLTMYGSYFLGVLISTLPVFIIVLYILWVKKNDYKK